MSRLLSIPGEVRNMIYREATHGAKVRFIEGMWRGTKNPPLSTCGALLVCCKQINAEFLPIFHEKARLDLCSQFDKSKGVLKLRNINLTAIQHVKLDGEVFASEGGMALLKAMSNLKTLTYPASGDYYIDDWVFEDLSDMEVDCGCCDYGGLFNHPYEKIEEVALNHLEYLVDQRKSILLGQCGCHEPEYGVYDCCLEGVAIMKAIGVWQFLGKPFKLVAEVDIEDMTGELAPWSGSFDLDSKEMTITDKDDESEVGRFDVDLKNY